MNEADYPDLIPNYDMRLEKTKSIKEWLKSNRGPPSKIFEKLNQSPTARLKYTRSGVAFSEIISNWPRLFDVDGAIQNDFNHLFPLAADNLFSKWDNISCKMMQYGQLIKRTVEGINISSTEADAKPMIAAFFYSRF
ncbi:uncharacterized protein LOC118438972 [Folsomia candida]|uniref:uncharacterized protein LOC118438972 n=1 Tax=Folsomia candida TaxID=158441 RepID=UPI001604BF69|nr:uncharacterized protein LOC118438972 [Folsomia candida]